MDLIRPEVEIKCKVSVILDQGGAIVIDVSKGEWDRMKKMYEDIISSGVSATIAIDLSNDRVFSVQAKRIIGLLMEPVIDHRIVGVQLNPDLKKLQ